MKRTRFATVSEAATEAGGSRCRRLHAVLLLGVALGAPTWATPPSSGELYVDASANCASGNGSAAQPFCTIGQAIRASARGDTIYIAPGTYPENVRLQNDVDLVGLAGAAQTVIEPPSGGPVVTLVTATTHRLSGLTLTGGTGYYLYYPFPGTPVVRGGGVYMRSAGASLLLEDVDVVDNLAFVYLARAEGGGIYNKAGTLTVVNSRVLRNIATPGLLSGVDFCYGGGIANGGLLTLTNSTVSANRVIANFGAQGGGLWNFGSATVRSSAITANGSGGLYGGWAAAAQNDGALVMENVTVAGNQGTSWPSIHTTSGGLTTIRSSIVFYEQPTYSSGSPPIGGVGTTVCYSDVELGWTGPGTGNTSVSPGFRSAGSGDYSLTPSSPCIDAGDPGTGTLGLGLGGNPRLLDGDLDRRMRVDMGAFEFGNGHLAVSGTPTPGGTLQITTTGTAGLAVRLAVSIYPGEALLPPLGILFFDLARPVKLVSLGAIPSSTPVTLPPTTPVPLDVVLQALFIGAPLPGGGVPANLSNPVRLRIE